MVMAATNKQISLGIMTSSHITLRVLFASQSVRRAVDQWLQSCSHSFARVVVHLSLNVRQKYAFYYSFNTNSVYRTLPVHRHSIEHRHHHRLLCWGHQQRRGISLRSYYIVQNLWIICVQSITASKDVTGGAIIPLLGAMSVQQG